MGTDHPFLCVMETPGVGNVIRIMNMATVEFPLYTIIEPLKVTPGHDCLWTSPSGWPIVVNTTPNVAMERNRCFERRETVSTFQLDKQIEAQMCWKWKSEICI
jgi:hypothetical protein